MNIKFYRHKNKQVSANTVFLVDHDEKWNTIGDLLSYAPIGQHGACNELFITEDAVEITKEDYIEASKGFYTPEEYLL